MKILLITLFSITCLSAQEFIGKEWQIDNFLGEYPDVTDVYFLKTPESKFTFGERILFSPEGTFTSWLVVECGNTCASPTIGTYQKIDKNYLTIQIDKMEKHGVECDSIPITLNLNLGSYYFHKISDDECYLVKSTGKLATDKQKLKDVAALVCFYNFDGLRIKSPNPSFQLKSDVPKDARIGKLAQKLFHLTNYQILKGFPNDFSILYLVKDLKNNTYCYFREEYRAGKVIAYYYTEKDIKKLTKVNKKKQ